MGPGVCCSRRLVIDWTWQLGVAFTYTVLVRGWRRRWSGSCWSIGSARYGRGVPFPDPVLRRVHRLAVPGRAIEPLGSERRGDHHLPGSLRCNWRNKSPRKRDEGSGCQRFRANRLRPAGRRRQRGRDQGLLDDAAERGDGLERVGFNPNKRTRPLFLVERVSCCFGDADRTRHALEQPLDILGVAFGQTCDGGAGGDTVEPGGDVGSSGRKSRSHMKGEAMRRSAVEKPPVKRWSRPSDRVCDSRSTTFVITAQPGGEVGMPISAARRIITGSTTSP